MPLRPVDDARFRQFHDRYLEPLREGLQAKRDRAWRQLATRVLLSLVVLTAIVASVLAVRRPEDDFFWWLFAFILLVFVVVFGIWCVLPWAVHKMRLKSDVLTRLLPFFGDFAYRPEPEQLLGASVPRALLPAYNKEFKEDEVVGSHAGVPLRALELRLSYEYTTGSSKSRRTVTDELFRGVLLEVGLARPVRGTVLFGTADMFERRCRVPDDAGIAAVELEPGPWRAWASEPAEAARVLGPELRARAETLRSEAGVKRLRMAWEGDKLGLLLDLGADLFELPQRGAIDFRRDAGIVAGQLGRLIRVIDLLGLEPVPGVDSDAPRPLEERMRWARPLEAGAEDEDRACLPLVLACSASFCLYVVVLGSVVRPIGVLLLAISFGMAAGAGTARLLFSRPRVGGAVLLAIGLLGLAPALPDETLRALPLGQWVRSLKDEAR